MKLFVKLMIVVLVAGLAGPFLLKRPDGKPWMHVSELGPDIQVEGTFAQLKLKAYRYFNHLRRGAGNEQAGKTKVYRWQAEDGSWRFSDQPNPAIKAEVVWLDPDTNLIAPPRLKPKAVPVAKSPAAGELPLPLTVSPARVQKLIKDARAVQGLIDKRYKEIEDQTQ